MDQRHVSLCENNDGPVTIQSLINLQEEPPDYAMPALVALGELMECCGVPNALQTTFAIASHFHSVSALLTATAEEIISRSQVTSHIAGLVACVGQTHHALLRAEVSNFNALECFDVISDYALKRLRGLEIEQVLVLLFDPDDRLISEHNIRSGTIDHVQIYPREVVRLAMLGSASKIILIHNHPSGDPTPSHNDIEMSRRVSDALAAAGVTLHEHLIVGANKFIGVRAMGLL